MGNQIDKPDLLLARRLNIAAWVVTVIVLAFVAMMRRVNIESAVDFSMLPAVNAMLNTVTALILVAAFVAIRRKLVTAHRRLMTTALAVSVLFLIGYVLYHFTTDETTFCREGWIRPVYYVVLITHIVLAAVILPFILFTFIRGYTGQYVRHRRMARWVWPLWLYVAVSGPAVYLLLAPCY